MARDGRSGKRRPLPSPSDLEWITFVRSMNSPVPQASQRQAPLPLDTFRYEQPNRR
jgi:hypothetical protein